MFAKDITSVTRTLYHYSSTLNVSIKTLKLQIPLAECSDRLPRAFLSWHSLSPAQAAKADFTSVRKGLPCGSHLTSKFYFMNGWIA